MFEHERTLYRMLHDYARRLVADVPEERMTAQPSPGMNHPQWVLGHLAICTDYAADLLGDPAKACPEAWHRDFGPSSIPLPELPEPPTKAALWSALESGHARVEALLPRADPLTLALPHPIDFLRPALQTNGELLAHLLSTHEAIHLGQLSTWRRAAGLPRV